MKKTAIIITLLKETTTAKVSTVTQILRNVLKKFCDNLIIGGKFGNVLSLKDGVSQGLGMEGLSQG